MPRTTPGNVQDILGPHYDGKSAITPFIETANSLVSRIAANDTLATLSGVDLELIERWLAAHFYAHADQLMTSKSTGGASGSFQGQTGMVLESTQYGQTAMLLDSTGYLSRLNNETKSGTKQKAQMFWIGKKTV